MSLPKAELHVHLRGATPPALFARQLERYPLDEALAAAPQRHRDIFARYPHLRSIRSPEDAPRLYEFQSFEGFLASYLFSSYFFRQAADFEELLDCVLAEFTRQDFDYVELTVSVFEYVEQGVPLPAIVEALSRASGRQRPRVRWIVDLIRNRGAEQALLDLTQLLEQRPSGWVGITIGGSEHLFPPAPFQRVYDRARDAGLRLSVHAGEACGPESVWDAVRLLGAERIGHGVRAVEDPRLVERLAERQIPLEVCLTSNVMTGVYTAAEEHPLPQLVRAGVPVTLNTDDPTFFNVTLEDEFRLAAQIGLRAAELDAIRANALRFAFDAVA